MNKTEREALKTLLAVAAQKELAIWLRPTDAELERLWDERINKQIDLLMNMMGDDGR